MSLSKTRIYVIIALVIAITLIGVAIYFIARAAMSEATILSIINGIATISLAIVAFINMTESKKVRGEIVRPHLSLEPSFFEYNQAGEIVGFNCLNLVNGGTVARDVEIDITLKGKSSLFYSSSIGTSERVQIWNGEPEELGGNVTVAIKYKNMFNKNLQEVLSINIASLNEAKRKFVPIHRS